MNKNNKLNVIADFYSYGDTVVIINNGDTLTAVMNETQPITITDFNAIDELTDLCDDLNTLENEQRIPQERSCRWWDHELELSDIQESIIDIIENY